MEERGFREKARDGNRGPNGLAGTGRTERLKNPKIGDKVQRTEGKGAEDGFEHKATNWLGPDREQGARNTGKGLETPG